MTSLTAVFFTCKCLASVSLHLSRPKATIYFVKSMIQTLSLSLTTHHHLFLVLGAGIGFAFLGLEQATTPFGAPLVGFLVCFIERTIVLSLPILTFLEKRVKMSTARERWRKKRNLLFFATFLVRDPRLMSSHYTERCTRGRMASRRDGAQRTHRTYDDTHTCVYISMLCCMWCSIDSVQYIVGRQTVKREGRRKTCRAIDGRVRCDGYDTSCAHFGRCSRLSVCM